MTGVLIAAIAGSLVGAFWWLVEQYGGIQSREPRRPVEPLIDARLRVSDTGERPSLGDPAGTSPPTGSPILQGDAS